MKTTNPKATETVYPIICQIVNTIPTQFIVEGAKAHKVRSRTFSPKSHVAAMLYCQVSKTESLNSICDIAYANEPLWRSMGATPPMRNTLSNANVRRPSGMAKDLYWRTFNHLTGIAPRFGRGPHRGYCFRIKAPMFAVDSSTIKLTMNSFDWAQPRRSKAAAKLHMTFDLGNRLPSFAIMEDAAHHDSVRTAELTGVHGVGVHGTPWRARDFTGVTKRHAAKQPPAPFRNTFARGNRPCKRVAEISRDGRGDNTAARQHHSHPLRNLAQLLAQALGLGVESVRHRPFELRVHTLQLLDQIVSLR